jgi:outer membrane receptor protein involved in Fe transport
MRWSAPLLIAATAVAATPAYAGTVAVSAPGGSAGDAAIVLARQTGTSIVIADAAVARRRVGPIAGRMSAADAVRKLARAAGAQALRVGSLAWRLVDAPRNVPRAIPAASRKPEPPPAEAPESAQTAEIVVLGSKRDTRLDDYPGQVAILRGEDLVQGGVGGTEKITQRLATVSSTYLGSGRNKLFIRGIADSSFTGPTQATVGEYLGDLRLSYNAPDPDLRLSDLERVEVLEGPQGTLYGAGSLGGIIRLVPNSPELGVTWASAIVGGSLVRHGAAGGDANAVLNLPLLTDRAALRVTIDASTAGGYIDKPVRGKKNVNRTNILGGRGTIRLALAPDWTVDVVGLAQTNHALDSQYADRAGPPLTRAAAVPEGSDADYRQGQVVLSGHLGDVKLRSTAGVTGQDLTERYDATAPGGPARLFVQANHTAMIADETRLWQPLDDKFGWLFGVSYTRNRMLLKRKLGSLDLQTTTTGVRNTIDEVTGYGEASVRLFDKLVATAGGRITHSRLGGEGEDVAPAIALANLAITARRAETAFLPSASLLAEVTPRTSLYMRYQESFRPGGLAIEGDFVRRFRSDHAATFEFGARHGRPGAGPFDLSASVSYTRWDHIQADFIDFSGLPSTANIGDGRVWTASLSGGVTLGGGLHVDGGVTLNDSHIDQPLILPALARTTQVPNVASFAGRLGFDYGHPIGEDLELTAKGWLSYVGRSRLGIGPELGEPQGNYLDSGVTARIGRDNCGVSLTVTNLADARGNRFALGTPFAVGRDQITPLQPRTVRVGFDAAF